MRLALPACSDLHYFLAHIQAPQEPPAPTVPSSTATLNYKTLSTSLPFLHHYKGNITPGTSRNYLACAARSQNPPLVPPDFRWAAGCACLRPSKAGRHFAPDFGIYRRFARRCSYYPRIKTPGTTPIHHLIAGRNYLACAARYQNPPLVPLDFRWAAGCACLRPSKADRHFAPVFVIDRRFARRCSLFVYICIVRSWKYPSRHYFPAILKVYHRHHSWVLSLT
mgnify:FL=1